MGLCRSCLPPPDGGGVFERCWWRSGRRNRWFHGTCITPSCGKSTRNICSYLSRVVARGGTPQQGVVHCKWQEQHLILCEANNRNSSRKKSGDRLEGESTQRRQTEVRNIESAATLKKDHLRMRFRMLIARSGVQSPQYTFQLVHG